MPPTFSIEFVKIIYIVLAHLEIASSIFSLLKSHNNLKYLNQKSHMLYFFFETRWTGNVTSRGSWTGTHPYTRPLLWSGKLVCLFCQKMKDMAIFVCCWLLQDVSTLCQIIAMYFLELFRKNGHNCCCINKYYELYAY